MPDSVQHSSSEGFVFLKHSLLASRAASPSSPLASLMEYPPSLNTAQHHSGALVGEQRPLRGVGQDKGASDAAPQSSRQPAPVIKGERRADGSGTPVQAGRA